MFFIFQNQPGGPAKAGHPVQDPGHLPDLQLHDQGQEIDGKIEIMAKDRRLSGIDRLLIS